MKQKINYTGLKAAILTMSFIQMATNAISSVLASIAADFPNVAVSTVQYLMTFPNLFLVIFSLIAAKLADHFSKKNIAIVGLCFGIAAGILSFLFHGSIIALYIWAAMLGTSMGLTTPMANSLIAEFFESKERDSLLGLQTSAANLGSMLMTFVGGYLAMLGWHYVYWVYLIAIPGLICTILFVPSGNKAPEAKANSAAGNKSKIPGYAFIYFVSAFCYMLMFYVGPTNLAMIVQEREMGSTILAGNAATVLLLGGVVMGILFGKVASKIGKMTIPCGFLMLVIGYLLIYFVPSVPVLFIGSFCIGTSNTLVLPQCMGSLVTDDPAQSTLLMAICLAVANIGMFLAPALTSVTRVIMGNTLSTSRFLFSGIVSIVFMIISAIVMSMVQKKAK